MITTIISFDGTTFSPNYEVGFVTASEPRLPGASVQLLERIGAWPAIAALQRKPHRLALVIRIAGTSATRDARRSALFRLFDPEDETPKVLVGSNHDGTSMYVKALCEELRVYGDQQHDTAFVVTLAIDGDVRWRATSSASDVWEITASAQTNVVANAGEDEAYPVITIEPTSARTGGYAYRCWVPVVWRSENAGAGYPFVMTLDTETLVTAGKMQADGDDLRVLSDGTTALRWLVDINTADTLIWTQQNFAGAPSLTLKTAIAATGDIASIEFNEAAGAALLPESGILLIDDEAFVYTARDLTDVAVTGITRAAKGTSLEIHAADETVHWIQHDIYIVYGNATATSGPDLSAYQPAFELDLSDNDTWVYEQFGSGNNARAGRWISWNSLTLSGSSGCYTAEKRTLATPYTAIGAWREDGGAFGSGWYLDHPCGIVNAAWADGWARAPDKDQFVFRLRYWVRGASWWSEQLFWFGGTTPLTADATWQAWSEAAAASDWAAADSLALILYAYNGDFEAGTVTVSLNSNETPIVAVNSEQGNYALGCTLTNETTGEAITVEFVMDLDSELEIDSVARTVTWLEDDSGQFQVLALSSVRRHWLRLLPGNNTLRFDDVGTGEVTVTLDWEARYY